MESDEVREEANLRRCPFAVRAIHLQVDVADVHEQHCASAGRFCLSLIQEPQRAEERDGVKHVRADDEHRVHGMAFDRRRKTMRSLMRSPSTAGGGANAPVGAQRLRDGTIQR